jgi:hypothetical protein
MRGDWMKRQLGGSRKRQVLTPQGDLLSILRGDEVGLGIVSKPDSIKMVQVTYPDDDGQKSK